MAKTPMKTEIAPLMVMARLEQYDYAGATAVGVVMLMASFLLVGAVNAAESWSARRAM